MPLFSYDDLYIESNNLPRTRALICQYKSDAPLSIYRKDVSGKVNLYNLYMQFAVDDPSEVSFAENVFGDIVYWKEHMSQDLWFKKHLEIWRMAAAEKRKSLAFANIIKEVKNNGKSSFSASRYLIEEPWLVGATAGEKKEIAKTRRASTERAFASKEFQMDIDRLKQEGILN